MIEYDNINVENMSLLVFSGRNKKNRKKRHDAASPSHDTASPSHDAASASSSEQGKTYCHSCTCNVFFLPCHIVAVPTNLYGNGAIESGLVFVSTQVIHFTS